MVGCGTQANGGYAIILSQTRHREYRDVQVAKLTHRMAGGTHKRWERADGSLEVTLMDRYSISRGRALRIVG